MNVVRQIQEFLRSIFQWWVTITPWQQGIRVRLGKHMKLLGPGVHARFPIIDLVYMQPIRVRAHHIRAQTITTADKKAVALACALQYQIIDLVKLYSTLHNAHDTIEQLTQGCVSAYIRKKELADIDVDDVEAHILESLNLERYGIEVVGFKLTDFAAVRTYRFISGEIGAFTSYNERLETSRAIGNERER